MRRNVGWGLARQLAREDPHLLATWLDHGGVWALERDPGAALAQLIRAGEHPGGGVPSPAGGMTDAG